MNMKTKDLDMQIASCTFIFCSSRRVENIGKKISFTKDLGEHLHGTNLFYIYNKKKAKWTFEIFKSR